MVGIFLTALLGAVVVAAAFMCMVVAAHALDDIGRRRGVPAMLAAIAVACAICSPIFYRLGLAVRQWLSAFLAV